MSKIVIDFKHEDVHQPKPWPNGQQVGTWEYKEVAR